MILPVQGIESHRSVGLGESQRMLLLALKRNHERTLAELESTGLARETVRDHLKVLQAMGLVERTGVRREGRGRPQVVYHLSPRGEDLFPQREGELLRELAEFLLEDDREALLQRFFAARNRAKKERLLGRLRPLPAGERLQALAAAMTAEGFLAEVADSPEGPQLRLCHCPWRRLVSVSHLPCKAELALVRELLGAELERKSFMPEGGSTCTYLVRPAAAEAASDRLP
jgi:predicted ArsR family transcriptional regulator